MFDLFSMENDSELDNINVENSEIKNDETAVDAAADPQKPVEVNITEEQAAHNEAASAGGCVVGDNEEQLSMDPIAAEESYIFERFGMSSEELDEAVDETIAEAEKIPEETETEDADLAATAVTDEPATTQDVDSEITVEPNSDDTVEPDPELIDDSDNENSNEAFGLPKISKCQTVSSVDSFFKSKITKTYIDALKEKIKNNKLTILKKVDLDKLKKSFFSAALPDKSKVAKYKEMGIHMTTQEKTVNGINFIILGCKVDNSQVYSVFVACTKNSKTYKLHLVGDMQIKSAKSKESLDDIFAAALGL